MFKPKSVKLWLNKNTKLKKEKTEEQSVRKERPEIKGKLNGIELWVVGGMGMGKWGWVKHRYILFLRD